MFAKVKSIQSYRLQVLRAQPSAGIQCVATSFYSSYWWPAVHQSSISHSASWSGCLKKEKLQTSPSAWFAAGHRFAQVNWKKETDCPPEAKLLNKKWLKFSHQVHIFTQRSFKNALLDLLKASNKHKTASCPSEAAALQRPTCETSLFLTSSSTTAFLKS